MTSQVKPSNNRSSYAFMIGLVAAAGFAVATDGWGRFMAGTSHIAVQSMGTAKHLPTPPRALSDQDMSDARVAWRYFENNTRAETGLVDSVAGFPSGTLWDQGSYLFAMLAAQQLGVISQSEFDSRVTKFIGSMSALPLFDGMLPNKAYNTVTLEMVDYDNSVSERGVGWSALDIARLLTAFRVLERRAPEYGGQVRAALSKWQLDEMAQLGSLTGAALENGAPVYLQEGRIGYEQYAARAAAMWGLDVSAAMSASAVMDWQRISGVDVPIDRRSYSAFRAITPTLSEPYILLGLEMGFDSESQILASRVYDAQWRRFRETGTPTMVSEDHINTAPYFLYSSVFSNGDPWAVVTEEGENHEDLRTVSLKAVFGWNALYDSDYTADLRADLSDLASQGGWMAGRYERNGQQNDVLALNTNAVVLEAIHYMAHGPLWQVK